MAKKSKVGTDVEQVKRQNQQSSSGSSQSGQFNAEFGSETNAQEVRKQNQQSQQNKK
ncbi:MAG TPA: gamma-type small acid-soluble spore protein [Candidatus Angelobacter sp.]|nr:gamma-type small acid-soluble spore protein [Candidatus Angelobacter sp.]